MSDTLQSEKRRALKRREAAERIGVVPETLCRWGLQGLGPRFVKIGGTIRYDADEVDRWLRGEGEGQ
jgi:hypothetical protein